MCTGSLVPPRSQHGTASSTATSSSRRYASSGSASHSARRSGTRTTVYDCAEAIRQLGNDLPRGNAVYVHLTLMPYIPAAGELKTKPTQHSVKELQAMGIHPDILLVRKSVSRQAQELLREERDVAAADLTRFQGAERSRWNAEILAGAADQPAGYQCVRVATWRRCALTCAARPWDAPEPCAKVNAQTSLDASRCVETW